MAIIKIIQWTCIGCITLLFGLSCDEAKTSLEEEEPTTKPVLNALLLFHSYTSYESYDSELKLYDFKTNVLRTISTDWDIKHPMNGHFSPDGRLITFMGIGENGSWDIFLYTLDSNEQPRNLTAHSLLRDEDPKFAFDGSKIVFKQSGQLAEYIIKTTQINRITSTPEMEYSMPYYSKDGKEVVCSVGAGSNSSICSVNLTDKSVKTLYDRKNILEYYPITIDEKSFYYTASLSENSKCDQLFRGFWSGLRSEKLLFNESSADFSDPFPVNDNWLLLSSTRADSKGGYDLYIASTTGSALFSLSEYNSGINTSKWELGSTIYIRH